MGHTTTDLAHVPSEGYNWYIFIIEGEWQTDIREALNRNFRELADALNNETLVVRGTDPKRLDPQIMHFYIESDPRYDRDVYDLPPALLITNFLLDFTSKIDEASSAEEAKKIERQNREAMQEIIESEEDNYRILLPLSDLQINSDTIGDFLAELVHCLDSEQPIQALEEQRASEIEDHWGWLGRYMKIQPNFMGFGVNVDNIVRDIVAESS
jgi:hypothetical protein